MKLIERPVRSIVRAIGKTARRWTKADYPPRARALAAVCTRTGYSRAVVEYAFDRLFASLTRNAIETAIAADLGSLDVLDRFVEYRERSRARAVPAGPVCIISSRTTVGVAIVPAIFALCAKCDVLVKDREDALVETFFLTLGDELPSIGEAVRAQSWNGESDPRDLTSFAAVVAFGDDATLARIRATLSPQARWLGFGTRASCGYVSRDALARAPAVRRIAEGAARDLVLYDTEGCLSLHVLFVEHAGSVSPGAFTERLARAIERAAVEFPPGALDAGAVAAVAGARDLAFFRATTTRESSAYSDAAASFLAVLDPPLEEPPFFLPRALAIYTVNSPQEAVEYLERHRIPIEAIAVAGMRPDIAEMALRIGAARIAPFGELQAPTLGGFHGGRPRIAEFVRWVTDQT